MTCRIAALLLLFILTIPAAAQDPLTGTNAETTVSRISFKFPDDHAFDDDRLLAQIATSAPGLLDRARKWFDFVPFVEPATYPFDPIELQRDVIRLQRFYRRNGFPAIEVDYPASQYDAAGNRIHIIFTVREGPPLRLMSIRPALGSPIADELQDGWTELLDDLNRNVGARFTEFERLRIENTVQSYLEDNGYAFSTTQSRVDADSANFEADLTINVEPLARGRVSDILVEGNRTVSDRTVSREVPLDIGDFYSRRRMIRGQQQIFGLNLFRLALADLPEQPPDSTVVIRYRVRETEQRFVSAQTGFSREQGLSLEGNLRHRNFLGGARQFSATLAAESGILASPSVGRKPVKSVNANVVVRQPYIFTTRLSGSVSPFYKWLDNPNQDTRFYETGISLSGLFELLPFRNLSGQYTFGRAVPLTSSGLGDRFDVYDRSILSLTLAAGSLDDFLNPRRGLMIRPHAEVGGLVGPSGVNYLKTRLEVTGYLPITRRISLVSSISTGRIWLKGASLDQTDPQIEFRFDNIRFYAGGAGDIRGWGLNTLGPQVAVADSAYIDDNGTPVTRNAHFESIGGQSKLSARVELRLPFPGLGNNWGLAGFLDAGQVSAELNRDESGRVTFTDDGIASFRDNGTLALNRLRMGTGLGMRYRTPVGLVRLDLAFKLNPSPTDLRDAEQMALFEQGFLDSPPAGKAIRRFNIHLSIDRSF